MIRSRRAFADCCLWSGVVVLSIAVAPARAAAQIDVPASAGGPVLSPRAPASAILASSVAEAGWRPVGSLPAVAAPAPVPGAATVAALSGPTPPCRERCAAPRRDAVHRCDDANRDGRCDIVFDPPRQGGFWRALGRFLLLSWLWDGDRDR